MGSAAEPERPPWEPWPACQPQMRAPQPKLPASRRPTTQLSSLNLPLLIRSAGGFWPIPFCLPCARTRKNPRFRPGPARFDVHYGKFRPVTARRGKPKTMATADFLGESDLYRQKDAACCVNVTNSACQAVRDPPKCVASTAAAEVFHILPDTGERFCNFAESDLGRRRLFAVGLEP